MGFRAASGPPGLGVLSCDQQPSGESLHSAGVGGQQLDGLPSLPQGHAGGVRILGEARCPTMSPMVESRADARHCTLGEARCPSTSSMALREMGICEFWELGRSMWVDEREDWVGGKRLQVHTGVIVASGTVLYVPFAPQGAGGGKSARLSDVLAVMEGMEPETKHDCGEVKKKVEVLVGDHIEECTFLGMLDRLQQKGYVEMWHDANQVRLKGPLWQPRNG